MNKWIRKALGPIYKKKINLLIEVNSFDKGGLEKVVLDMVLRLRSSGYHVIIVCMGKAGVLKEKASMQGIPVYLLGHNYRKSEYREIIEKEKINITNSHFSYAGYEIFQEYNIPNVTFIHNVYAFLSSDQLQEIKKNDHHVNIYISVSKNATRYAIQKLGLSRDKIVTIPNGLILDEHQKREKNAPLVLREAFGIDETDYLFLNVASYNLHKGHYLMADAMKKILSRQVRDIKILCIGNTIFKPHVDAFKTYVHEQGLEEHLLLPGYFQYVESFYKIADAFILPSFIEGWSIAMNEAMYYEKPMILSDTGASKEVIQKGHVGIVVENEYGDIINLDVDTLDHLAYYQREFYTSGKLADAMITFSNNRAYWKNAGKKGRQIIKRHFDFDLIIKQYIRVFNGLVC